MNRSSNVSNNNYMEHEALVNVLCYVLLIKACITNNFTSVVKLPHNIFNTLILLSACIHNWEMCFSDKNDCMFAPCTVIVRVRFSLPSSNTTS